MPIAATWLAGKSGRKSDPLFNYLTKFLIIVLLCACLVRKYIYINIYYMPTIQYNSLTKNKYLTFSLTFLIEGEDIGH